MRLKTKFNLALLATFSIGLAIAGSLTFWVSKKAADKHVLTEARIMMEGARAVRQYTVEEINPLLLPVMKGKFYPQTVAAHAAQAVFRTFRENFPDSPTEKPLSTRPIRRTVPPTGKPTLSARFARIRCFPKSPWSAKGRSGRCRS